jgi:hypothetical protein
VNVLPQETYRDPLEQLLRAEAATCKGCCFRRVIDRELQCTHPRTADPLTDVRCAEYEERV